MGLAGDCARGYALDEKRVLISAVHSLARRCRGVAVVCRDVGHAHRLPQVRDEDLRFPELSHPLGSAVPAIDARGVPRVSLASWRVQQTLRPLLLNTNIEELLLATEQNLKRPLAAMGWGRRRAPCGLWPSPGTHGGWVIHRRLARALRIQTR